MNKLGTSVAFRVILRAAYFQAGQLEKLEPLLDIGGGGTSQLECFHYFSSDLCSLTDVSPESPDHYLTGHCIDGRVLYPATGYLVLAWRTLARSLGMAMEEMAVVFEDVTIHQATIIPKKGE